MLIDQDGSGPGGSDQMAMLALLQSPDVQVLGITIVTGDAWRDEETLHTLRMLELTGHTDVPVCQRRGLSPRPHAGRDASRIDALRQSDLAGRMGPQVRPRIDNGIRRHTSGARADAR